MSAAERLAPRPVAEGERAIDCGDGTRAGRDQEGLVVERCAAGGSDRVRTGIDRGQRVAPDVGMVLAGEALEVDPSRGPEREWLGDEVGSVARTAPRARSTRPGLALRRGHRAPARPRRRRCLHPQSGLGHAGHSAYRAREPMPRSARPAGPREASIPGHGWMRRQRRAATRSARGGASARCSSRVADCANGKERSAWSQAASRGRGATRRARRRFQLTHASAPAAMNQLAEIETADLIVLGATHREAGRVCPAASASAFSTALRARLRSPPSYGRSEHAGLGLVGVGYDGHDESKHALGFARRSRRHRSGVAPDHGRARRVVASEWATEAGQLFRRGDPAAVLAQQGAELDLLVVGSAAFGRARAALSGEVSHEVMRTAPCPVIVVPRPRRIETSSQTSAAAR